MWDVSFRNVKSLKTEFCAAEICVLFLLALRLCVGDNGRARGIINDPSIVIMSIA